MNRQMIFRVLRLAGIAAIVFALTLMPGLARRVGAESIDSTPAVKGYIDHDYGAGVKAQPTSDGSESKLWFNDGIWWGILFNAATTQYEIYQLDWGTQTWNTTNFAVDSRKESIGGVPTGQVATRADVLWDGTKLYIASHIKVANPSRVTSSENWARLYRYSYSSVTKAYTLDTDFPVDINRDKTETLVLDKDSTGRLWITYLSRVPTSDPADVEPYKVYVNYTTTAGNDLQWNNPLDLGTITPNAVVGQLDLSTLITYGSKVGVMWSNSLTGFFYYAEHNANSAPDSSWNVQAVDIPGVPLLANDHLRLVANAAGQVFAALKTDSTTPGDPLVGVLARETNGTFSFSTFAKVGALDTRPIIVLNETENKLYLFVTSGEGGGVICVKPLAITTPLTNMSFSGGDCTVSVLGSADHFISDTTYTKVDNSTTSKHNVNNNMGIVVLASDDVNGSRYLHNVIGGPAPTITAFTPAQGETVTGDSFAVTATFSQDMDPATFTTATFKVSGPNGAIPGTVTYDAPTRKATFLSSGTLNQDMTVQVQLTTGIKDSGGRALASAKSWSFHYMAPAAPIVTAFTPSQGSTVTGSTFVVTATFSQAMDPATLTTANFIVSGPNGVIPGALSYDPAAHKATFQANGPLSQDMTVQVQLTTGIKDATGLAMASAKSWSFKFNAQAPQLNYTLFLPKVTR